MADITRSTNAADIADSADSVYLSDVAGLAELAYAADTLTSYLVHLGRLGGPSAGGTTAATAIMSSVETRIGIGAEIGIGIGIGKQSEELKNW